MSTIFLIIVVFTAPFTITGLVTYQMSEPDFSNLLSDQDFERWDSATKDQIQLFFEQKNSWLKDPLEGKHPSEVISQIAEEYKVNPLLILARMQTEQSAVETSTPSARQRTALTGCGCPNVGGCNPKYSGVYEQLTCTAQLYRKWYDTGKGFTYPREFAQDQWERRDFNWGIAGKNQQTVKNAATYALYKYTPHTYDYHLRTPGGGNYLFINLYQRYMQELGVLPQTSGQLTEGEESTTILTFSSPFQYITHPSFTIQGDYDLTSHLSSYREYILMAQRVKEQFLECMKKGSDVAGNDNPQGDNDAESCAAFAKRQVRPLLLGYELTGEDEPGAFALLFDAGVGRFGLLLADTISPTPIVPDGTSFIDEDRSTIPSADGKGALLSWGYSPSSDIEKYRVYCSDEEFSADDFKTINTRKAKDIRRVGIGLPLCNSMFIPDCGYIIKEDGNVEHKPFVPEKTYYFTVVGIDEVPIRSQGITVASWTAKEKEIGYTEDDDIVCIPQLELEPEQEEMPVIPEERREEQTLPPSSRVLAVGDSITQHGYFLNYLSSRCPSIQFDKIGYSGCSAQLISSCFVNGQSANAACLRNCLSPQGEVGSFSLDSYDTVIILAGVNEVSYQQPSVTEEALSRMYAKAKSEGKKVIALTITPWNGASDTAKQRIQQINSWILSEPQNVDVVVDTYAALDNGSGQMGGEDTGDGLHPNQQGGDKMGEAIRQASFPTCI
ncbi:MAG: hypothetical protein QS99_C0018G0018 [archaeon GW2011_AR4]|nr:MAG: hypothetical protein QS99_C0018G0018 [archaeon GW2011_AR4]